MRRTGVGWRGGAISKLGGLHCCRADDVKGESWDPSAKLPSPRAHFMPLMTDARRVGG